VHRWERQWGSCKASLWERQWVHQWELRWVDFLACEWVLLLGCRSGMLWERKCELGAMSVFPWEHQRENRMGFHSLDSKWVSLLGCPMANVLVCVWELQWELLLGPRRASWWGRQ